AGAVREQAARRLEGTPLDGTIPSLRARTPLVAALAAVLSLAAAATLAPADAVESWRTMWAPGTAAPPVAILVEPGDVTLVSGASLSIRARIEGSIEPPKLTGEGAAPAPVLESSEGAQRRWRFDLPPVTAPRDYAVRVAATSSPNYRIELAGEPRAVSFAVTLTAPASARLPRRAVSGTGGDLPALAGSTAGIEVTLDRDLETVS